MTTATPNLEKAIAIMQVLSPLEKIQLLEEIVATLKYKVVATELDASRSLYGLWSDVHISSEEIDEARKEMWGNFPREDI